MNGVDNLCRTLDVAIRGIGCLSVLTVAIMGGCVGFNWASRFYERNYVSEAHVALMHEHRGGYLVGREEPKNLDVLSGRRYAVSWHARDPEGVKSAILLKNGGEWKDLDIKRNDDGSYPKLVHGLEFADADRNASYQVVAWDSQDNKIKSETSVVEVVE